MKQYRLLLAGVTLVALAQLAAAQPPESGGQNPPPGGRPGGPRQPGEGRPALGLALNPLFRALDENKDGELSETEINNAPAALHKLDSNKDGKVSREELRPQRPEGAGDRRPAAEGLAERLMSQDKNGDGKVAKDELPERMQRNFDRLDTNKDGFIDRTEADAAGDRLRRGEGSGDVPPRRPPPGQGQN